MALNLDALVINIIVTTIVVSPALWLAGRAVVGNQKAKFSDAVLTVVVGTLLRTLFSTFFSGIIATIIQLLIWLGLVRHFFECGWLTAFGISLLAIIIFIVVAAMLGLVGFALFTVLL